MNNLLAYDIASVERGGTMETKTENNSLTKWKLDAYGSLLCGLASIFFNWIIWIPFIGFVVGLKSIRSSKLEEVESRDVAVLGILLNVIFFIVGLISNGHLH